MRFSIKRTSDVYAACGMRKEPIFGSIIRDDGTRTDIEISSIEDLVALSREVGECLIIDGNEMSIEVYDGHRE